MNPTFFLSLLIVLHAQIATKNYFQNLPISPALMTQANSAVNDLHAFLDINFNCPADDYYPGGKSTPSSAASSFNFQNFAGGNFLGGFQGGSQPQFGNCLSKTAYGFPSMTLQYFNPLPCNYLDMGLLPYTQKFTLYNQLRQLISIFSQIKAAIKQAGANNVVVGNNNAVAGQGNVVIGSNDTIRGNRNWILTSNYASPDAQDGALVMGNYMIELKNYFEVLQNPSLVVNCLNTQQAAQLVNVFWSNTSPVRRYWLNN